MDNLDDMLGSNFPDRIPPAPKAGQSLDDLLGPAPKKRGRKKTAPTGRHKKLERPSHPLEGGIFDLRAKAKKDGTLGVKCLKCGVKLKKSRNGQRVICDRYDCFRFYRNAYRAEYDR